MKIDVGKLFNFLGITGIALSVAAIIIITIMAFAEGYNIGSSIGGDLTDKVNEVNYERQLDNK